MRTLIQKLFLSIILNVLFLFVPSAQHATEIREHEELSSYSDKYLHSRSIENPYVSFASSGSPGNTSALNTAGPQSVVLARWDIFVYYRSWDDSAAPFTLENDRSIPSHAQLPAGQFADALIRQIFNWSRKPSEEALDDDLTLTGADYQHV